MIEVIVRAAAPSDVDALPLMQVAAGVVFRELNMDLVAEGPAPSADGFRAAQATGDLLVAVRDRDVVGFVRTRPLDGALHVEQVTVAPEAQRRGVGRALMVAAERSAAARGFSRMTLTTFRDVAFNGLFYRGLGWVDLDPADLTAGLRTERDEEIAAGLDRWPRVAMEKRLTADGDRMTSNEPAGPRILGTLQSVGGQGEVVMQDRFAADLDTVWRALTDKQELAQWLGDFTGDFAAGRVHHARFHASGAEGDRRIDECQAAAHFRVTALDDSGQDGQVVEVTLTPDGDGTVVALVQSGLPLKWIVAFGAGMQVHFEDLARHLAGLERSKSDTRMDELMPLYEKRGVANG